MDDLKPCPFCGGIAQERWKEGRDYCFAFVVCKLCGAQSRIQTMPFGTPYKYSDRNNRDSDFWKSEPFHIVRLLWNHRNQE